MNDKTGKPIGKKSKVAVFTCFDGYISFLGKFREGEEFVRVRYYLPKSGSLVGNFYSEEVIAKK